MRRFKIYDVEFIVDEDIDDLKKFLEKTDLVYRLSNCHDFEYIGEVSRKNEKSTFNFGQRLRGHAKKISINSNEKVYKNGLARSKRIKLKILKEFDSPDDVRVCEHNTILHRRMQIANAKGYNISIEGARDTKNSYMWDDILLNVIS